MDLRGLFLVVVNSELHLFQPVEDMNAIFRRIDESERQYENGCGERPGVRENHSMLIFWSPQ